MAKLGIPTSTSQNNKLKDVSIKQKRGQPTRQEILEKVSGKSLYGYEEVDVVRGEKHNKVGKDEFLKMLTHQMQNQDPFNPMDQNKFAADLAQFAQLEQMTTMNKKFDGLTENASMEKKFLAASFIGKKVIADGNTFETKEDGEEKNVYFNLPKKAKNVIVRVMDNNGGMAREIKLTDVSAGSNQVKWDGKAMDGMISPAGQYKIAVLAWDGTSQAIPTQTRVEGVVKGVNFDGNVAILDLGGKKVSLRDVHSFSEAQKDPKKTKIKKKAPVQSEQRKQKPGRPHHMQARKYVNPGQQVPQYKKMDQAKNMIKPQHGKLQ